MTKRRASTLLVMLALFLFSVHVKAKLIFTEIMIHPQSATTDTVTNWFELYNTGPTTTVAMNDWIFQYCNTKECNSIRLSTTKTVAPFGYVVLGNNADTASNGGVQVDIPLRDFVIFTKDGSGRNEMAIVPPNSVSFDDAVFWSTDVPQNDYKNFTFAPGSSLAKISALSSGRDASNWKPSTARINCAQGADKGTPGKINTFACPPTKAPTKAPLAPVKSPTKAPVATRPPTKVPMTKAPMQPPSPAPFLPTRDVSKAPTKAPVRQPSPIPTLRPAVPTTRFPISTDLPKSRAPAPVPPAPFPSCGLFGLRILCANGCGILGRLFGFCRP